MEFGKVHCADCEKPLGHFPADSVIPEDIELYCNKCVKKIKGELDE